MRVAPGNKIVFDTYGFWARTITSKPWSVRELTPVAQAGTRDAPVAAHWREFCVPGHKTPYKLDLQGKILYPRTFDTVFPPTFK